MHTILKVEDGTIYVGMWLINRDGYASFNKLLKAPDLRTACIVVCMLNGGARQTGVIEQCEWL